MQRANLGRAACCANCFRQTDTQLYPIRYATASDPTVPRQIPLCTACRIVHAKQYATLCYTPTVVS
jgi:hypothetical protein